MDPSAADYWKGLMPGGNLPTNVPTTLQPPFIPDYAWHAAAGFGLPTHMPFVSQSQQNHLPNFDQHHTLTPLDHHHKMGMKMDIKNEYGDTYGTSEMYAAGVASMGGDHFANPLATQPNDAYDLNSAALTAVSSGNPSDLLMGLANTGEIHGTTSNLTKEQLNAQQEAIRAHPLYPFLTVLFERCELATSTPRDLSKEPGCRQETAAEMFKDDLMAFVKSKQEDKLRFYVADPELDKLMLGAIQVLRIHLLELEKVHELCDHFCQRYVNTLKDQMQMDMMHEERSASAATNNSPPSPSVGPSNSHNQYQPSVPVYEPQIVTLPENMHPSQQQLLHQQNSSDTSASGTGYADLSSTSSHLSGMNTSHTQQPTTSTSSTAQTPNSANGSHTPNSQQHYIHQQQELKYHAASSAGSIGMSSPRNSQSRNGSTPNANNQQMMHDDNGDDSLSIDGGGSLHEDGHETPDADNQNANGQGLNSSGELNHSAGQQHRSESSSSSSNGKRKVPKVFAKDAITKFRAWLFQNLQHPYPSEEQKKQLAHETNLTILQVNNWFINARRRIVQPMIDSNNRAGRSPHTNVFRNRRRRNSEQSPGNSPGVTDANVVSTTSTSSASATIPNNYSPDNSASMMNVMAASAAPYPAMFPSPYGFTAPAFGPQSMFMNVAPYGMNTGGAQMAPNWMDFGGNSMDN